MFKCVSCSHIFELPEFFHNMRLTQIYDIKATCPKCNSPFTHAHQCNDCGEWFRPDEDFYNGWCHKCALQNITKETATKYLEQNKLEALFYGSWFIDSDFWVTATGSTFIQVLGERFWNLYDDEIPSPYEWDYLKSFISKDIETWIDLLNAECFKEDTK